MEGREEGKKKQTNKCDLKIQMKNPPTLTVPLKSRLTLDAQNPGLNPCIGRYRWSGVDRASTNTASDIPIYQDVCQYIG